MIVIVAAPLEKLNLMIRGNKMKHILPLLILTVMLKIWWHDLDRYGDDYYHESIVISADYKSGEIFVKDINNDMDFHWITKKQITNTQWIDKEADK